MMVNPLPVYAGLAVIGVLSLYVDLKGHKGVPSTFKSVMWTLFWIAVGLAFGGFIYALDGAQAASEYYSGYLMEKALSFDNLMVFIAIFSYFGIKDPSRMHKVLTAGILGAIIFRGIFVGAGSWLFHLWWPVQVVFGLIVLWSAKAVLGDDDDEEVDYQSTWYIRCIKKVLPVDVSDGATSFFTRVDGKFGVTMLFLCAVAVELSDVMFSFDSVPAVIGVAKDTPIIYSAMIMAVLGLRALYFVIEMLVSKLHHLSKAVALILVFIGGKLIAGAFHFEVDNLISLSVVGSLLALGVLASLLFAPKETA